MEIMVVIDGYVQDINFAMDLVVIIATGIFLFFFLFLFLFF